MKKEIANTMPGTIETMAWAYQQICAGEDPWTALGNFTNAWYGYAKGITNPHEVWDYARQKEISTHGA